MPEDKITPVNIKRDNYFENKVIAITGAGSGIGRDLAIQLSQKGATVAISDIDESGLEGTAEVVKNTSEKSSSHLVDVSDKQQVHSYADDVVEKHGKVDIIINNAAIYCVGLFEDLSYSDFESVFSVNFWGVVYGTKAFLPHLMKRTKAQIVNISSGTALAPLRGHSAYGATKFAVKGFSEILSKDLRGTPIKVTTVFPGTIRTKIQESVNSLSLGNCIKVQLLQVNPLQKR